MNKLTKAAILAGLIMLEIVLMPIRIICWIYLTGRDFVRFLIKHDHSWAGVKDLVRGNKLGVRSAMNAIVGFWTDDWSRLCKAAELYDEI